MSNKVLFASLFSSLTPHLLAVSLNIVNDSVYPLRAEIYNAAGAKEGAVTLSPRQQTIWYGDNGAFRPMDNSTTTPYTVRFICEAGRPYDYSVKKPKKGAPVPPKYQSAFGSWEGVPPSATVTAQGCTSGSKTCVVKKHQKQPDEKPGPSYIHPTPKRHPNERPAGFANDGTNAFSNDGGLTWTNDGGSPFEEGND